MSIKLYIKLIIVLAVTLIADVLIEPKNVSAASFNLSPMYQNITLVPGETYVGNFNVTNLYGNTENFDYSISIVPFSVGDENNISLTANGDYNQMVDWVRLDSYEGSLAPNETAEVRFYIDVPNDAAAGGQYASILIRSKEAESEDDAVQIREIYQAAHLVYAEVAGETIRKGDISDIFVPGFLLSGNISGSAKIKNLGNVHSRATATLQIYPLFSQEEVFTNEENPDVVFIMPGTTRTKVISWEETPSIGIFHVIYNVEYEGVESKVDKMVIVCPLWLLFLILLALFLLIFRILSAKKKSRSEK